MAVVVHTDRTTTRTRWVRALRSIIGLLDSSARPCTDVPVMDDPLTHLTAALRGLIARQREIDRLELAGQEEEATPELERWRETNTQAIEHLERTIAAVPAAEAGDAVVQVLIALGRIQALQDRTDDAELIQEFGVLRMLLRSAVPVLADKAGIEIEAYGADHYGVSEATSPFLPVKRA